MTTWSEFANLSHDLAGMARDLLTRSGTGETYVLYELKVASVLIG